MKLLACHIDNFGKLCDVNLQFQDGLNVINEANAWGKSTLAAFLKAMFYGLDAKKNIKAFEKERIMYRPWQGGAFGGELDFELNGKKYRISRTFGRTEKTDEFHLYDLSTNLECYDFTEDIGNEIFELDSASFKRSIYIAQNDCSSETSDRINAKLGNLAENTDDINNFESANKRLKDILNQLTPDRVTGSIKKRKSYITQLSQEIRGFEAAQGGLEGIQAKKQQVAMQIQELLAMRKSYADALVLASEDSRRKALYTQYDAICRDAEDKEEKKNIYKQFFQAGIPSETEFQAQLQNLSRMAEIQTAAAEYAFSSEEAENYEKLKEMFAKKVPETEEIETMLQAFHEIDKQKEEIARQEAKLEYYKKELETEVKMPKFPGEFAHKLFLGIGIFAAIIGIAALVCSYFELLPMIDFQILLAAALITGCCGVLFGIISIVLGLRVSKERHTWQSMRDAEKENLENKAKKRNDSISSMKEDVRKTHSMIGKFLGDYHIYCGISEYQQRLYELKAQALEYLRLCEKRKNCENKSSTYQTRKEELLAFVQKYQFDLGQNEEEQLRQLYTKATEHQVAEQVYAEACAKKEAFERQQDKAFWTKQALCPYSVEELNAQIAQADEKLENLKSAKTQYEKQIENLQEQLDLRDEKEEELKNLYADQEKEIQKYQILKMTQDFLHLAKEQFTARYMDPIAEGFAKYYTKLTGDERQNWMLDANINLRVKEQGELRETYWLSAGYQDLIGVCMRLALVDAMYQDEKPFLILDDPFVNLDQEKVTAGNELLCEVAKEYQVIYFTCHDSRCPIIE